MIEIKVLSLCPVCAEHSPAMLPLEILSGTPFDMVCTTTADCPGDWTDTFISDDPALPGSGASDAAKENWRRRYPRHPWNRDNRPTEPG